MGHLIPTFWDHLTYSAYSSKLLNSIGFTPGILAFLEFIKCNFLPFLTNKLGQLFYEGTPKPSSKSLGINFCTSSNIFPFFL